MEHTSIIYFLWVWHWVWCWAFFWVFFKKSLFCWGCLAFSEVRCCGIFDGRIPFQKGCYTGIAVTEIDNKVFIVM